MLQLDEGLKGIWTKWPAKASSVERFLGRRVWRRKNFERKHRYQGHPCLCLCIVRPRHLPKDVKLTANLRTHGRAIGAGWHHTAAVEHGCTAGGSPVATFQARPLEFAGNGIFHHTGTGTRARKGSLYASGGREQTMARSTGSPLRCRRSPACSPSAAEDRRSWRSLSDLHTCLPPSAAASSGRGSCCRAWASMAGWAAGRCR
eukprot:SAG31_NODE_5491_length_2504_cov_1.442412_4_plen_203_part_00